MAWREVAIRRSTFATVRRVRVPGFAGSPFIVAYGHSFTRPPAVLALQLRGPAVERIVAIDRATGRIARLWPTYARSVRRGGELLRVAVAASDAEIALTRALLQAVHGEGAARDGMLIGLYSVTDGERLIGAAQLGEYYHTHFPGRAAFGRRMLGGGYDNLGRGEVIRRIPLSAAKRFAVLPARQGEGLGDLLAREVRRVARNYRWPPARVVEVSRYMPAGSLRALCCEETEDFLSRSGYTPVPPRDWMHHGRFDPRLAVEPAARTVPGYYYADLTGLARPSFFARLLSGSDS